jgi:ABC-type phosphate transport system auxiliary subunit
MKYMSVKEIHFYMRVWLNRILFYERETDLYIDHVTVLLGSNSLYKHLRPLITSEMQLATKKKELAQLKEYINQLGHKLDDYQHHHVFAEGHQYIDTFEQLKLKFKSFKESYGQALIDLDDILYKYIKAEEHVPHN